MAVRNSISSGHNILSTIHADKAESIPSRMYSLLETNQDIGQFLTTIHRYVQLGVHIKGYYSQKYQKFHREVAEVVEFYVTEDNKAEYKILYKKTPDGRETISNPSKYLLGYLESQGVIMPNDILVKEEFRDASSDNDTNNNYAVDQSMYTQSPNPSSNSNINIVGNIANTNNQNINPSQNITSINNQNATLNSFNNGVNNIPNMYATNIPKQANITGINNNSV